MINYNLENDLQKYCQTLDSDLFENAIYQPLCFIASSICSKLRIPSKDMEDTIIELVSIASTKLPKIFDKQKGGTAKAMVYIIMNQYLLQKFQYNQRNKRSVTKTIYLEDLDTEKQFEGVSAVIEIEIDQLELYKNTLLENEKLFKRLKNKLHKKIALTIINVIKHPEKYECNNKSYVKDISKHCKTNVQMVYFVIDTMKRILSQASPLGILYSNTHRKESQHIIL